MAAGLGGVEAYRGAYGCTEKAAAAGAERLLLKPEIIAELQRLRDKAAATALAAAHTAPSPYAARLLTDGPPGWRMRSTMRTSFS